MDNAECIHLLRKRCKEWGGNLVELSDEEFKTLSRRAGEWAWGSAMWSNAPFSSHDLGVKWTNKEVVYCGDVQWTEIVHEMGHVFASKNNPDRSSEFDFFGWEHALCLELGLPVQEWIDGNKDYVVGKTFEEFGSMTHLEKVKTMQERTCAATKLGLIDERGKCHSIR